MKPEQEQYADALNIAVGQLGARLHFWKTGEVIQAEEFPCWDAFQESMYHFGQARYFLCEVQSWLGLPPSMD